MDPCLKTELRDTEGELAFLEPSCKPGFLGRLGLYHVQAVVGRGGMGLVLKGFDEKLERVVALKVMSAALADNPAARQRFVREARAAAAVTHDNVVGIYAVEDDGPIPYLVLQFILGRSLEARIKEGGPLSAAEVVRIGIQIAAGLEAAHQHHLIHRDIKPANILLEDGSGRVKITDFGLARAEHDASITQSGYIAGTPMYMSPEQAEGKKIDPRSDLFSLGSVLYAACTGRAAFGAKSTVAVLRRVCDTDPCPIRDINPDVPAWLERVINKLLAKDPAQRYQTAGEVGAILQHHFHEAAEPAQGSSARTRMIKVRTAQDTEVVAAPAPSLPRRPPRLGAGLIAGLAGLVLLAGLVFLIVQLAGQGSKEDEPNGGPAANGGKTKAPPLPGVPGKPIAVPLKMVAADNMANGCIPHTYSPDGKLLVTAGELDNVRVWDMATGELQAEMPGDTFLPNPVVFRPDGSLLALSESDNGKHVIVIRETKTFNVQKRLSVPGDRPGAAFSRDGKLLAIAADRVAILWDVAKGQELARITDLTGNRGVAIHPDGKMLALSESLQAYQKGGRWALDARVSLWDIDPQSPTYKQRLHQWEATDNGYSDKILFNPKGDRLIFCRGGGSAVGCRVVDTRSGAVVHTLRPEAPVFTHVVLGSVLPDGKTLAILFLRPPLPQVQLWDLSDGKLLHSFAVGKLGHLPNLAIDPTGQTVAVGGRDTQQLLFYDVATGKELLPSGRVP
jgi:hypothetical protein